MHSILVISDEPALLETLAAELPDIAVTHARFGGSAALKDDEYRLIVIDENDGSGEPADNGKTPAIRLSRPVRLRDLLYTIRERLQGKTANGKDELALPGEWSLSLSERLVRSGSSDIQIPLTEKETELLQCLLEAGGEPIPRDVLLKRIWGYSDDIATHTLETHIYRLRGKLRQVSESLDVLSSETGGYQLKS